MNTSLTTRLTALFASVAVTLVLIEGMALIGHPAPDADMGMALASVTVPATTVH